MTNCGCSDECVTPKTPSSIVYICSADTINGSGFTYPANNAQAFIGILSTVFVGVPNFNTPGQWCWLPNNTPLSYSNEVDAPPTLTATFQVMATITVPVAGNYIAFASGHGIMAATVTGYVQFYVDANAVIVAGSQRFWLPDTHANSQNNPLSVNTIPFAVTAGQLVRLMAKVTTIEAATNFNFATLVLLRVQ